YYYWKMIEGTTTETNNQSLEARFLPSLTQLYERKLVAFFVKEKCDGDVKAYNLLTDCLNVFPHDPAYLIGVDSEGNIIFANSVLMTPRGPCVALCRDDNVIVCKDDDDHVYKFQGVKTIVKYQPEITPLSIQGE